MIHAKQVATLDLKYLQQYVADYLTQHFASLRSIVECHRQNANFAEDGPDVVVVERLVSLLSSLTEIESALDPKAYPVGRLQADRCFEAGTGSECNTRLAGFALAAFTQDEGDECWQSIDGMQHKHPSFQSGYLEWWKTNGPLSSCSPPPEPIRCTFAACWDHGKHGIGLRPAAELGATFGDGLGFAEDGKAALQFSGSLGARAFFFDDAFDLHASLGVGASASASADPTTQRSFLVLVTGVSFWNGIAGANFIHTFDPFKSDRESGNGVSFFADVAALDRVAERVKNR